MSHVGPGIVHHVRDGAAWLPQGSSLTDPMLWPAKVRQAIFREYRRAERQFGEGVRIADASAEADGRDAVYRVLFEYDQ